MEGINKSFKMTTKAIEGDAKQITYAYGIKYSTRKKSPLKRRFSILKFRFVYYFYLLTD